MLVESLLEPRPTIATLVCVFWPQGRRGRMVLAVGPRTARRMRGYEVLMSVVLSAAVRWIFPGLTTMCAVLSWLAVAWLGWPALVSAVAAGLSVPIAFLVALWLVRVPQHPVDRGEGWVVLRRIDLITAQHWQLLNPAVGMVIEAASRRARSRPSNGQNWWQSEPITPDQHHSARPGQLA